MYDGTVLLVLAAGEVFVPVVIETVVAVSKTTSLRIGPTTLGLDIPTTGDDTP